MKRLNHTLVAAFAAMVAAMVAAMGLGSCSMINDDSDCVDSYNIFEFHYDRNLKFADAFTSEVKSVTLLGFDETGTLVHMQRARQSEMGSEGNSLEVRMKPGEYDFLVWAGDYDTHFNIPAAEIGKSKLADFTCLLRTEDSHADSPEAPADHGHSSLELENLYHALVHLNLDYASPTAPARKHVYLTKNTNSIRVMLQQQNATSTLSANDFIIEITDRNAHLNHDNSLNADAGKGHVMYHPWHLDEGTTDYIAPDRSASTRAEQHLNVVLAEFTTSRLHTDAETRLNVRKRDGGDLLFSIPLQEYALMVRSEKFSDMDSQEFLDRQDEYSLTFILDENQRWIAVTININGWRMVKNNVALS